MFSTIWTGGPASAEFTENSIGCAGSAVIEGDAGSTSVDAADKSVVLPVSGDAAYEGSVETITHNHFGEINLAVGPAAIQLGSWKSKNDSDLGSKSGTKELPAALADVPPGKYEVSGFHQGDEGRCAGRMTIEVPGSILSSPISAASTGIAVVALIALLIGALRGKPLLAGFAGFFAGLFGGLDLVFARVVGSDSILLAILPVLLLVAGVIVGFMTRGAGARGAGVPPAPTPTPV